MEYKKKNSTIGLLHLNNINWTRDSPSLDSSLIESPPAPARRLRVGLCWSLCYLGPGGALAEIHPGDDHKQ